MKFVAEDKAKAAIWRVWEACHKATHYDKNGELNIKGCSNFAIAFAVKEAAMEEVDKLELELINIIPLEREEK